jgi:HD domain-containing protein/type II secretion system (T2SS) protein E
MIGVLDMQLNSDPAAALAERMISEGRISPALAQAALERRAALGEPFEEALLECGLPESMLLRHLAEMFRTKFITASTLATASVPKSALARLTKRHAEQYQVLPVRFDPDDTLTIVTFEPDNADLLERVRVTAGARQVKALISRPAAVQAAITRLYGNDTGSFAKVLQTQPERPSLEVVSAPQSNGSSVPLRSGPMQIEPEVQLDTSDFNDGMSDSEPELELPLAAPAPVPRSSYPAPSSSWSSEPPPELDSRSALARAGALGEPSRLVEALMVIQERSRGSLKSHSVRVARLCYQLCIELGLSEPQAGHAWAIGLFHDLGKAVPHHLTALNVWQLADHEAAARAQYQNPMRLLRGADIADTVLTAITHMYERYDGGGFPNGLREEAIPFQARVVALCDSIADLTLNPDNTLGRLVSPLEACSQIRAQTPKVFDPTLLAHFSRLLVERRLDAAFFSEQSVHGIEKLLG